MGGAYSGDESKYFDVAQWKAVDLQWCKYYSTKCSLSICENYNRNEGRWSGVLSIIIKLLTIPNEISFCVADNHVYSSRLFVELFQTFFPLIDMIITASVQAKCTQRNKPKIHTLPPNCRERESEKGRCVRNKTKESKWTASFGFCKTKLFPVTHTHPSL